ncbi:hypothetical protein D8B26_002777 [Coccidioides posadasii str. Silveira]|uniref:uncharacterized protein n=1 Tax=Coccidioides posadasii (strain RMSCC 757 / Silveira) TaxID=443226 RepID=UPI001BF11683|nr:hypothetical protein D8B26_002777 [Coccidioides posadasii str. Silveira]
MEPVLASENGADGGGRLSAVDQKKAPESLLLELKCRQKCRSVFDYSVGAELKVCWPHWEQQYRRARELIVTFDPMVPDRDARVVAWSEIQTLVQCEQIMPSSWLSSGLWPKYGLICLTKKKTSRKQNKKKKKKGNIRKKSPSPISICLCTTV